MRIPISHLKSEGYFLMNADAYPVPHVVELAAQALVAQALYVAASLEVADELGDGMLALPELARRCEADEDALRRILRALAAQGIFFEEANDCFRNTADSMFLRRGPRSLRDLVVWIGEEPHWRVYGGMLESVKTGASAWSKVHGKPIFESLAQDYPRLEGVFQRAMEDFSRVANEAVLDRIELDRAATVADIGGGLGHFLKACLTRHSHLAGVVFDRPHVLPQTVQNLAVAGLASRTKVVAGDFFESIPVVADVFVLKHILHDWSDADATRILKNLRAVPVARLIVMETVLAPSNAPHFSKVMDLDMLVSAGGRERTEEEFHRLLGGTGFRIEQILPTHSPLHVLECRPA